MARKKKEQAGGLTGNEWLATYADTVTLLLTFFVLLYSTAAVDTEKVKSISTAFSMMNTTGGTSLLEFDMYDGEVPLIGGEAVEQITSQADISEKDEMYMNVKEFISTNNLTEVVEVVDNERGISLQLRDNILFESASSDIKEDSKAILNKINELVLTVNNNILIEGHTDNIPINTDRFPSNWELSVDRAVNVVRYFIEIKGQNPKRFSAAGYGEYQPISPNDSYENMAKNRRVEILILTSEAEEK